MRQLPHMNELNEKPGLHVYTLYAQVHPLPEIDEIINKHEIKYPIAMDGFSEVGFDTSGGLPQMWIVGADGKVAFIGVSGYSEALDKALEQVKYPGLGKTAVAKELTEAARAFGDGEFAKAYKLAEAVYDNAPNDEVEAEAEYIMERIDDRMGALGVRAETAEVEKNYNLAIACWKELARYKGLGDAEEAPERLKALTDSKEVQNEIARRRELLKIMCDLDVQFQDVNEEDPAAMLKFRKGCLKLYRTFARDNAGTNAADEAEALVEIFERIVGEEEAKSPDSMPDPAPKKEPGK
ncbi:MAG: hypothetical protein K8I27_13770 [Planctomycetes bacterium]|nr:hypothetical protein [Planctomycetota bacterium]